MADLLIDWEDGYKQGQDTPAAVLCKDHPELTETLARQIAALKRVSWLDAKLGDDGDDHGDDPPDRHRPPKVLAGRYRLDELIATGGFAEVWRAFDQELERIIAVKIPKKTALGSSESFSAEARRVARLKHPAILPVYDVGLDGDDYFFVSEYVEGGSLADHLTRGKLAVDQACQWMSLIADALDHAHRSGVIHRDVKPANILIDAHGRALLADFGIAHSSMQPGNVTPSIGTLRYMSPEQLAGQHAVPQSDIYSLAVVLHECLSGMPPYSSTEPNSLRRAIEAGADVSRDVPKRFTPLLRKALNKDPSQRYGSAAEFATLLREFSHPSQRSLSWLAQAAVAIAVLAAVSVLASRFQPFRSRSSPPALSGTGRPQGDVLTNSVGMQLRLIPEGTFTMGSDDTDPHSHPAHEARITKPFYLGAADASCSSSHRGINDPTARLPYLGLRVAMSKAAVAPGATHDSSGTPTASRMKMPYPLPPMNRRVWRSQRPDRGKVFRFDEATGSWCEYGEDGKLVYTFRQTRVTDDAIDIEDPWRQMRLTLTATTCNTRSSPTYPHDTVMATGDWNDHSASPYPPRFDTAVTIESARDTLEHYLLQLSQLTGMQITIDTAALQAQGITKNQSFGLDAADLPAGDVLSRILGKADPEGRLRAVLRATDDGQTAIDVTTTHAVETQD